MSPIIAQRCGSDLLEGFFYEYSLGWGAVSLTRIGIYYSIKIIKLAYLKPLQIEICQTGEVFEEIKKRSDAKRIFADVILAIHVLVAIFVGGYIAAQDPIYALSTVRLIFHPLGGFLSCTAQCWVFL